MWVDVLLASYFRFSTSPFSVAESVTISSSLAHLSTFVSEVRLTPRGMGRSHRYFMNPSLLSSTATRATCELSIAWRFYKVVLVLLTSWIDGQGLYQALFVAVKVGISDQFLYDASKRESVDDDTGEHEIPDSASWHWLTLMAARQKRGKGQQVDERGSRSWRRRECSPSRSFLRMEAWARRASNIMAQCRVQGEERQERTTSKRVKVNLRLNTSCVEHLHSRASMMWNLGWHHFVGYSSNNHDGRMSFHIVDQWCS